MKFKLDVYPFNGSYHYRINLPDGSFDSFTANPEGYHTGKKAVTAGKKRIKSLKKEQRIDKKGHRHGTTKQISIEDQDERSGSLPPHPQRGWSNLI